MAYSGKTGVAAQYYFPHRHRRIDGGLVRKVRVLKCSEPTCGREVEIFDNGSRELPNNIVAEKFARMGCEIGKNRGRDLCEVCASNQRFGRRKKEECMKADQNKNIPLTERAVMNGASPSGLPEEMPREMGTDERRLIFACIDERWAGKEEGYKTPWTDQSIASDLGVPVGWVSDVREQFFGAVRDNSEIRELLDRISSVSAKAAEQLAEAQKLMDEAREINKKSNSINAAMIELRRSVEGAIAIANRIERSLK